MRRHWACYATAVRMTFVEHLRNRLASVIIVVFIPMWAILIYALSLEIPLPFYVRAADRTVTVPAGVLNQLGGALQILALITGFMMFVTTMNSASFDRRLVRSGFPHMCLIAAKLTALVVVALCVALYATGLICLTHPTAQPLLLAAALAGGALIYGGIGIALAAVLTSDLAGLVLVTVICSIDLALQSPLATPAAASALVRYLPDYGPMQAAVAAVAMDTVPWNAVGPAVCWALGTVVLGISAFAGRTRAHQPVGGPVAAHS
ncbi:ABC transporter permease [Microbispora sp. KK1-11]|uniref:ABC transporter permease n=1 Tax=Microbispora sp. KK1-11 TaxID=2053005 RepID=UPI00115AED68|nr:ABC transporter permease [Microbispora sp. KK1-11]TQS26122.1 ABC transporter permease [Microbispora sp. KK1-11]